MFSFFKKDNKGFTLIELLSVVVILGVLMIIAVPSVTEYIADSRKKTYVNTAQGYIKEVKNMITSRELTGMKRLDTTYYVPISCIHTESGGDSPFGSWESAYVVVIYSNSEYKFYWTSNDITDTGILLTPEELLNVESVKTEINGISTAIGIGGRDKILVLNELCNVAGATTKSPSVNIDEDEPLDEDEMVGVEIEDDALRPTYDVSPEGWAQSKTVTIKYPHSSKKEYSLDGGVTWEIYDSPLTFTSNTTIITRNTVDGNYINGNALTVSQIDPTAPTSATFTPHPTSNTIKVIARGTDAESGILYYQFSKDGGSTWTDFQTSGTYTFTGLTTGTYNIKIRVINRTYTNNGLSGSYKDSAVTAVSTTAIGTPTYTIDPNTSNWVHKKKVTINYEQGYTNHYSLDGGVTWQVYTAPLEFTGPANIIARSNDGINYVSSSSQAITNIDPSAPTVASFTYTTTSNSIKVIASGTDSESGIHHYQFSKDGGGSWTAVRDSSTHTFTGLTTGTYNIKVRVINNTYTHHGLSNNYKESGTTAVTTDSISIPTYTISPSSGWATNKTVTINFATGYTNEYSLDGGNTWLTYSSPVVFTANGTILARSNDGVNYVTGSSQSITSIDTTPPTDVSFTTTKTSNSITVTATANDDESGVLYYQFSKDGGTTWTTVQSGNTYTFTGLLTGDYSIKVRAINGTYVNNGVTGSSTDTASQVIPTTTIPKPTYTINPSSGWAQSKTVTITYPSGYTNKYSLDNGSTWNTYTGPITFNATGSVVARSDDGVNYVSGSSQNITSIDTTAPTAATFTTTVTSKTIKVVASGTDTQSGITHYQFSKDNGSTWTSVQTSNTYTFTDLTTGSYDIKVRVINATYVNNGLNNNYKDSSAVSTSTTTIAVPTYSVSPSGYAREKTVTITYPSGYTNQYSLDGGTTWNTYSGDLTFTAGGTVVARVNDGINYVTASSQTVSQIDRTNPTCVLEGIGETTSTGVYTNGATVQFKSTDGTGSPVVQYGIGSLTGGTTGTLSTSDASKTFTGYVKDSAGNEGSCSITLQGDSVPPTCSVSVTTNNSTSGITFTWSCTDTGSGVSGTSSGTVSSQKSNWSKTVSDIAGNSTTINVNVASKTQYRYRDCASYDCTTEVQDHCGFTSSTCSSYCSGGSAIGCYYSTVCKESNQGTHYCRSNVTVCDKSYCKSWGSWSSWSDTSYTAVTAQRDVGTQTIYYKSN